MVEENGKENFLQYFKSITNFDNPYPHQLKVAESLQKKRAVLLRAPTGSGKTEAVLIPFLKLRGKRLPNRLLYSLPIRVLVNDIGKRIFDWASRSGLNLSVHHGRRIEDPMFQGDIIITTVDQTVAAYACTPLNFSQRHGSIPAGAVATSLLVFDEIQLLDPELGLQAILVLAKHSIEMGFPVVIMTATLPSIFIEKFAKELPYDSIDVIDVVDEKEIPARAKRAVRIFLCNRQLTVEEIESIYKKTHGKMIVICNTVRKAQELYCALKITPKYLLHSRFLSKDREEKEERIRRIFGKDGDGEGILITTQVIEAGTDISSPLVITEIAPADTLVQRAGRCARFGGKGKFLVYGVEESYPYPKELVKKTKEFLQKTDGADLTWSFEKSFVDEVMSAFVEEKWLKPEVRGKIIALLAEASFDGDKNKSSQAVRAEFSCELSLCKDPISLGEDVVHLERIRVPFGILRKWIDEFKPQIWEISESNIIDDDMETKWSILPVSDAESILPFHHYIINSEKIGYDKDLGLIVGLNTEDFPLVEFKCNEPLKDFLYKRELWIEHSRKVEREAKCLLASIPVEIETIAQNFRIHRGDLEELILTVIKLHDIGKLNKEWQDFAGWDGKNPLAHSTNASKKFPPHATVSAFALNKLISKRFSDNRLCEAVLLAIAHHHSLRSSYFKRYCFILDWKSVLFECDIDETMIEEIIPSANHFHLPTKFPKFQSNILYRAYLFFSRILKFADWQAVGGEKCHITY